MPRCESTNRKGERCLVFGAHALHVYARIERSPIAQSLSSRSRDRERELWASRKAVMQRCRGKCEASVRGVCSGKAEHCHHKRRRGTKDDSPANLLGVCWKCHSWIHDHPAESYDRGWLVRVNGDEILSTVRGNDDVRGL